MARSGGGEHWWEEGGGEEGEPRSELGVEGRGSGGPAGLAPPPYHLIHSQLWYVTLMSKCTFRHFGRRGCPIHSLNQSSEEWFIVKPARS